jgi:predicted metal-dependent HD superfamily phosphohydrolase
MPHPTTTRFSEQLAPRWNSFWQHIGGETAAGDALFAELIARYNEPHRAYHNLQHIRECLGQFEQVRDQSQSPILLEMALWSHDVIYDPHAKDNEAASATWIATRLSTENAIDTTMLTDLIIATEHKTPPETLDAQLLVDIDLSILGSETARFDEYETQIRAEYNFVPDDKFCIGRTAVLQHFLARPALYSTPFFHARYEEKARENLARSLQKWQKSAK